MASQNLKILAIDHSRDNLRALKGAAQEALPGTRILTALSRIEGLESAVAEDPDVILLNIAMSHMDGLAICRELKADPRTRDIPVLFLTPLATDPESRIQALASGADGFLSKPIDKAELMAQIRAMAKIKAANTFRQWKMEVPMGNDEQLKPNLDAILDPDVGAFHQELADILDLPMFQSLAEAFTQTTGLVTAILDLEGNVLAATGWQDICTQFHRVHPQTAKNCTESDLFLAGKVRPGEFAAYKCKNQLWDMVTPLFMGDRHLCNIYTGQLLFEDEPVDIDAFAAQADRYGFDKDAYLGALDRIPRVSREKAEDAMRFLTEMTAFMAKLAFGNIKLAKALSKQKQTEEALREREEKYRLLFEEVLNGFALHEIIVNDMGKPVDYVFLEVNSAFEQLTGLKRQNIIGRKVTQVFPGTEIESGDWIGKYGNVALSGQAIRFEQRSEILEKWYSVMAFSPRKGRFATIFEDITERKRIEEELTLLRLYLKNMFDSMPSILVGVDREGQVTQWNVAAEQTTGLSADKARGRPLQEVMPALGPEMRMIMKAIATGTSQLERKKTEEIGSETTYSDIMVYPLISNGVKGAVIRMDDVTDRIQIEEMMIQTEKMMSVGGLAAGMAHEINNPLGAILQGIQNTIRRVSPEFAINRKAAEECGIELEAVHRYLEKRGILKYFEGMREAGSRAAKIVANMLDFSRRTESKLAPTAINDLTDSVLELAGADYDLLKKYDFRHVEIVRDYGDGLWQIPCTATEIEQVFLNMIRNAAEAMAESKGNRADPRIIIRTRKEKDHARIEIEDNGPGIEAGIRNRVFEPFFTTKPVGMGTGLGLSVSYFIITHNHNGTLSVESEPESGAKFIIRLPLERKGL